MKAGTILSFAALRKVPNRLYSSDQIAELAAKAVENWRMSMQLRELWKRDPRFKSILSPKALRAGFANSVTLKQLVDNIELAREQ